MDWLYKELPPWIFSRELYICYVTKLYCGLSMISQQMVKYGKRK